MIYFFLLSGGDKCLPLTVLLIRHYILESRMLFLHGAKGVVLFDHELKPKIYELKGGGGVEVCVTEN